MIFNLFVTHLPLVIPMRAPTYRNSATGGRDVSIVEANNGGRSLPPTRTTCSYLVGTTHKPARWANKLWDVWTFKGSHCQLTNRVRKWQSTPMHLGCTSTVPGCRGESTSVAIGKLYESSLLHYCWRASQIMHQRWIHFPFIDVASAVVGTTIWHSSGISNVNIFAGNQTPPKSKYSTIFAFFSYLFLHIPCSQHKNCHLGTWVQTSAPRDASTHAVPQLGQWLRSDDPFCAIKKFYKKNLPESPSSQTRNPTQKWPSGIFGTVFGTSWLPNHESW